MQLGRLDRPREECGVVGVAAPHEDAARMAFFGLFALQHRGQEAAGIAVAQTGHIRLHKEVGLVAQVFDEQTIATLRGRQAIGHTRYSTTGASTRENAQPFLFQTRYGPLAVAHNGNLVNAPALRRRLLDAGVGLTSTSDTEVMALMLARAEGATWLERIARVMPQWVGAYSLVVLTDQGVLAARDPWGLRPLSVGQLPNGGHAVASETCALDLLGCTAVREVRPGEVVALHEEALVVRQAMPPQQPLALCTFEHIYFSRPDSVWDGRLVHAVRVRLGERLAQEAPVEADLVVPVPDSSIPAALGYSRVSGIPVEMALIKNRYIGRTFIQPSPEMRKTGVLLKFNPLRQVLRGQRVVLIDDSIVRGTTSARLVRMMRAAGAAAVHLRVTCPPIRFPCYMGVDMPTHEELIAHRLSPAAIAQTLGVDSLHYLSLEGMMDAIGRETGYCNACFTGRYPFPVPEPLDKHMFEEAR